jgi:hypothetical protein
VLLDLLGGLLFAAVCGSMAYAYEQVRAAHPETLRSLGYVDLFSPPLRSLVVAPHSSFIWGAGHAAARDALGVVPPEKTLLCGYVLYLLAGAGLLISAWTIRQRIYLGAGVVLGVVLLMGTKAPLYQYLFDYLPGFDSGRTPGRLILWPTLLLGLLAAGFVTEIARRTREVTLPEARSVLARAVTVPLLLLVLLEGLPKLDHIHLPDEPAAMAVATAPMMVLPSDDGSDLTVMLWSVNGFPEIANGASSIVTPARQEVRTLMQSFPSAAGIARLRSLGIHSVVVVRDRVAGTPYQGALDAPVDGLGITRVQIGPDVLYQLG